MCYLQNLSRFHNRTSIVILLPAFCQWHVGIKPNNQFVPLLSKSPFRHQGPTRTNISVTVCGRDPMLYDDCSAVIDHTLQAGVWLNLTSLLALFGRPFLSKLPLYEHETNTMHDEALGAVSIRKTVLPGMAIPMLKIRRPNGRLIFNMEITIRR